MKDNEQQQRLLLGDSSNKQFGKNINQGDKFVTKLSVVATNCLFVCDIVLQDDIMNNIDSKQQEKTLARRSTATTTTRIGTLTIPNKKETNYYRMHVSENKRLD